ncbi:MAG: DinB family protein, partial [Chloroflexi bacterium]
MGKQVNDLIAQLLSSLMETMGVLSHLSDAELDDVSEHPCAMGGNVRDLLNHNIDHEQMHTGQVYSLRYSLRKMQKGQVDRLTAETLRARANLIASLIGLDDKDLDARNPDDEWTV